jgi:hypothetical protein
VQKLATNEFSREKINKSSGRVKGRKIARQGIAQSIAGLATGIVTPSVKSYLFLLKIWASS